MRGRAWTSALLACVIVCLLLSDDVRGESRFRQEKTKIPGLIPFHTTPPIDPRDLRDIQKKVKEMFYHGYDSYHKHAYPADELKPLSCTGRVREPSNPRGDMDDVLGNYLLTELDSITTLIVMGDYEELRRSVERIERDLSFKSDLRVSLFEITIRGLGALVSAHSMIKFINQTNFAPDQSFDWYHDQLLDKALDLGMRLLPAFFTPTGIPFGRVNLIRGILENETKENCLACIGTLSLEFKSLARLSGFSVFESVINKSQEALISRRSVLELFPTVINIQTGTWLDSHSSIGAGCDSFYEYLLKSYVLFLEHSSWIQYRPFTTALEKYSNHDNWFYPVSSHNGGRVKETIDSLMAFWPGLQVLEGDLMRAIKSHGKFMEAFRAFGFIPESFLPSRNSVIKELDEWPLRPEFIESTYFLFKATGHPFYLHIGRELIAKIEKYCRVDCGYATISVLQKKLVDRMDSFFLSETLKYLYLLFDVDDQSVIHHGNFVFTTEAHPLPVDLLSTDHHKQSYHTSFETCKKISQEAYDLIDTYFNAFYVDVKQPVELYPLHHSLPEYTGVAKLGTSAHLHFKPGFDSLDAILIANKHTLALMAGQPKSASPIVSSSPLDNQQGEPIDEEIVQECMATEWTEETSPILIKNAVNCKELLGDEEQIKDQIVVITPQFCDLKDQVLYLSKLQPKAIVIIHPFHNSSFLVPLSQSILFEDLSTLALAPVFALKSSAVSSVSHDFLTLQKLLHESQIRSVVVSVDPKETENTVVWVSRTLGSDPKDRDFIANFLQGISQS